MRLIITILLTLNLSFLFGQVERKSDFQFEIIDSISTVYLNNDNCNFNYQLCNNILNINISDSVKNSFLRVEIELENNKEIKNLNITLTEIINNTKIEKYHLIEKNIKIEYFKSSNNEISDSFSYKLNNNGFKTKKIKGYFNIKLSEIPCEIVYNKLDTILPLFNKWKVYKFIDSIEYVVTDKENLSIKFNGNKIISYNGCNEFEGDLWIKNDSVFEITTLWSTLLYCPEYNDKYEKKLFNAISRKEVLYYINRNTLTLVYNKNGYRIILYSYKYDPL